MPGRRNDREIASPGQLPQTLTEQVFISRQAEVEDLRIQLNGQRWLTIVGVGGCGKTTLAWLVAQNMRDQFEQGACWIALDTVDDPALVSQTVATALGIPSLPANASSSLDAAILEHLAGQHLLLVLDNCEHVLDACRTLCDAILANAPRVTILATSRATMGSPNETRWDAPLLTLEGAMTLFFQRTHLRPDGSTETHTLVAEICRRVDFLPLAIELAAAQTKLLSLTQIRDRLAQMLNTQASPSPHPTRHDTMRAALDWSYGLLSRNEKQLFARLSVFAGGFTLDAAEAVCADESLPAESVLALLSNLLDHSLITIGERGIDSVRYRLLEPVREFAAQRLSATSAFEDVHRRHLAWCHTLMEEAARHWRTRDQTFWLNKLQTENGNMRAALRWCLHSRRPAELQLGLEIASAAGFFWEVRSAAGEGERWLRELLAAAPDDTPEVALEVRVLAMNTLANMLQSQGRHQQSRQTFDAMLHLARLAEDDALIAKALNGAAQCDYNLGEFESALRLLKEAEPLARGQANSSLLPAVLGNQALVLERIGDLREAQRRFEELLALHRAGGDTQRLALTLHNLALVQQNRGDYAHARQSSEEALIIWRELDNQDWQANTHGLLSNTLLAMDRLNEAEAHALASLQILEQLGNRADQTYPLATLAQVALRNGKIGEARDHLQRMNVLARENDEKPQIALALRLLALTSLQEGDLSSASMLCAQALSMQLDMRSRFGVASSLEAVAQLCVQLGRPAHAAQFLGAATAIRASIDRPRPPFAERLAAQSIEVSLSQMGRQAFDLAWQRGAAQPFDAAARSALEMLTVDNAEPEPDVRCFGFGNGEVHVAGHAIDASDWTYAKARELVFYLLLHPNATREEIGANFWPNANTEQVRKRFSAALTHARSALGRKRETIILTEGRYRIHPALRVWFDVQAFDQALSLAQHELVAERATTEQPAIRHLERATQLYRGDLLQGLADADWVFPLRDALREKCQRALLQLGKLYLQAGAARMQDAIAVLQRALALDEFSEAAHLALIRAHLQLGNSDRARQQLQSLLHMLQELGAPPSPETAAIARRLSA